MMKPAQFLRLLSGLRQADDTIGAVYTEIAMHVLSQWHAHGNRTPHMQMCLAVFGGTDEAGAFGEKGATVRGLSAGIARMFANLRKLPKRDESADVESIVVEMATMASRTVAEAREDAKAQRQARETAKAKAAVEAEAAKPEPVTLMLIDAAGAGLQLTPAEHAALLKTLQLLRDQDAIDAEIRVVEIVEPAIELPALL